jgi:hypothetical protein
LPEKMPISFLPEHAVLCDPAFHPVLSLIRTCCGGSVQATAVSALQSSTLGRDDQIFIEPAVPLDNEDLIMAVAVLVGALVGAFVGIPAVGLGVGLGVGCRVGTAVQVTAPLLPSDHLPAGHVLHSTPVPSLLYFPLGQDPQEPPIQLPFVFSIAVGALCAGHNLNQLCEIELPLCHTNVVAVLALVCTSSNSYPVIELPSIAIESQHG